VSLQYPMPAANRSWDVALGVVPDWSFETRLGLISDLDVADGFQTVGDIPSYSVPTAPVQHNVASTLAADTGTVVSSGTATSGDEVTLGDTLATFVTDGVVVGDPVLIDGKVLVGRVSSVTETVITMSSGVRDPDSGFVQDQVQPGDSYRIVQAGSTGSSFVYIKGLGLTRDVLQEFVVLDGVTPVPTVESYLRMNLMRALSDQTGASTQGFVSATAIGGGGGVTAQINDGNNVSLSSVYTIPRGYTGLLTQVRGSLLHKPTAGCQLVLRSGIFDGVGYLLGAWTVHSRASSSVHAPIDPPLRVPGTFDVWIEADTDTNGVQVTAGYSLALRKDPVS